MRTRAQFTTDDRFVAVYAERSSDGAVSADVVPVVGFLLEVDPETGSKVCAMVFDGSDLIEARFAGQFLGIFAKGEVPSDILNDAQKRWSEIDQRRSERERSST